MTIKRSIIGVVVCAALCLAIAWVARAQTSGAPAKLYNTAKQKLMDGKKIFGVTVVFAGPEHLLRHGQRRVRFHLDRDAAQHHDL